MQVPLCSFYVKLTQQILDISDVGTLVEQVRGKAVAQVAYAHFFFYAGFGFCKAKYLLHRAGGVGSIGLLRFK
jgi:hypothetical protein